MSNIAIISWEQYIKDRELMSEIDKQFLKSIKEPSDEKKSDQDDLKDFVATLKNIIIQK